MNEKAEKFILVTIEEQLNAIGEGLLSPQCVLNRVEDTKEANNCSTEEAIFLVKEEILVTISSTTDKLFKLAAELTE